MPRPAYVQPVGPATAPPAVVVARPAPNLWGLVVLVGGVLIVGAQAIQLEEATDELEGKDQASYLMMVFGGWIVGLGLLLAGCFSAGSLGARAAFLIAGAFLLAQGTSLASLMFGFGFGSDF